MFPDGASKIKSIIRGGGEGGAGPEVKEEIHTGLGQRFSSKGYVDSRFTTGTCSVNLLMLHLSLAASEAVVPPLIN